MVKSITTKKDNQMEECSKNVKQQNISEKSVDANEGETLKDTENADVGTKTGLMTETLSMVKKSRSRVNAVDTEISANNLNDNEKVAETPQELKKAVENAGLCEIKTDLEKVNNLSSSLPEMNEKMNKVPKSLKIGVSKLKVGKMVEKSEILNKAMKKAKSDADTSIAEVRKKRKVMESTEIQGKSRIKKRKVLIKNMKGKEKNKDHVKLKAGRKGMDKTRKMKRVAKEEVAKKQLDKMKEHKRTETAKPSRKDVIRKRQNKGVETPKRP